MKISHSTKIAALLKHEPRAIDAIIGISPKFSKLKNPWLRKLLAGRTTIYMASKIGGCGVEDFFEQLKPLGFEVEETERDDKSQPQSLPSWLLAVSPQDLVELDVRPLLDAGRDPLKNLLAALNNLSKGQVLKIVNTFEPSPLIALAGKKGFAAYCEAAAEELVFTYFYRLSETDLLREAESPPEAEDWGALCSHFSLVRIDVRDLPMPQPMLRILDALEALAGGQALFVDHKKVPVFLLPELRERGFDYRIKEIEDQHVQLMIFKG